MQDQHDKDSKLSAGRIARQLLEHPQLLRKFEEILATLDVEKNSMETADEAEMHILELTRKLEKDLLQEWAQEKQDGCVEKSKGDGIIKNGKKTEVAFTFWSDCHHRASVATFPARFVLSSF